MTANDENLWGSLPEIKEIRTPLTILKHQAALLQEMTGGLVAAEAARAADGQIHFRLVAPALGNYRSHLFTVTTNVPAYPCILYDQTSTVGTRKIDDEQNFREMVGQILKSEKVRILISSLVGQIRAEKIE